MDRAPLVMAPITPVGCGPGDTPKLESLFGCSGWQLGPLWDSEAAPWEFSESSWEADRDSLEGLAEDPPGWEEAGNTLRVCRHEAVLGG